MTTVIGRKTIRRDEEVELFIVRCDGCGKEAEDTPKDSLAGVLSLMVGVVVGTVRHDVNACSAACFPKAIAKSLARATPYFAGAAKSSPPTFLEKE